MEFDLKQHKPLLPFFTFGWEPAFVAETKQQNSSGSCPFLDCTGSTKDPDKPVFFVSEASQLWDCKVCGRSGNYVTFLREIHAQFAATTTLEHYQQLAEDRYGIPVSLMQEADLVYDKADDRWLIPYYNDRSEIIALRVFKEGRVRSLGGAESFLYGMEVFDKRLPTLICEGEWDTLAMVHLLSRINQADSWNVLGLPGVSIFRKPWHAMFRNAAVYFLFDHDMAGVENSEKHSQTLSQIAAEVGFFDWPSETPSGFDIRDLCIRYEDDPEKTFGIIEGGLVTVSTREQKVSILQNPDIPTRTSFDEIIEDLRGQFYLTDRMIDGVALMAATILSVQIPGDPVWLFVVGPPGSGKTALMKSFMDSPKTIYVSSLTSKALVSGYNADEDPSLIRRAQDCCMVLKDFTEVLQTPKTEREEVLTILRGAYDGYVHRYYGNNESRIYDDVNMSLLAGVTDEIHDLKQASVGERFLKYQFADGLDQIPKEKMRMALRNMEQQAQKEHEIRGIVSKWITQDIQIESIPSVPSAMEERIICLAELVAPLRSSTLNKIEELDYRPTPEDPTRLAKQFKKLLQTIGIIRKQTEVDEESYRLVQQVAVDTVFGYALEVARIVANSDSKGLCMADLTARTKHPHPASLKKRVNYLRHVGVFDPAKRTSTDIYELSDDFLHSWQGAFTGSPPVRFSIPEYAPSPNGNGYKILPRLRPTRSNDFNTNGK